MEMLDIWDSPSLYLEADESTPSAFGPVTAGLSTALAAEYGERGEWAGLRLAYAGRNLRYSLIGTEMVEKAGSLADQLGDTTQYVNLAGFGAAATFGAVSLDLCAAALVTLHADSRPSGYETDFRDLARNERHQKDRLTEPELEWVEETDSMLEVQRLIRLRDFLVHRSMPQDVRVLVGEGRAEYTLWMGDDRMVVDDVRREFHAVAVDRFVSLARVLHGELSP